jgi:hypothetical protein
LALAILEHWLLVLPLADGALWRWAVGPAAQEAEAADQRPASAAAGDGPPAETGGRQPLPATRSGGGPMRRLAAHPQMAKPVLPRAVPIPVRSR